MKQTRAKLVAASCSIVIALALAEIALAIDGRYNGLVSQTLVTSPAIWDRAPGVVEQTPHPDLRTVVETRTDADGVRNHSPTRTREKRGLVGVFGDSFTENRRVDDRFTFTTLLDETMAPGARVVNYGVDGYGLDQSYLRYKKYEDHDLRHVVYLFGANDFRNLYETGLAQLTADDVVFRTPRGNLLTRTLGRVRLTYLGLSVWSRIGASSRSSVDRASSDPVRAHETRFHDAFAEALAEGVLKEPSSAEVEHWARTFLRVLERWQREVHVRQRTFTMVVLPRAEDSAVARRLVRGFRGSVVYLEPEFAALDGLWFVRDGHWNEYGNLRAAEVLAARSDLPFHAAVTQPGLLAARRAAIDEYYRAHRRDR